MESPPILVFCFIFFCFNLANFLPSQNYSPQTFFSSLFHLILFRLPHFQLKLLFFYYVSLIFSTFPFVLNFPLLPYLYFLHLFVFTFLPSNSAFSLSFPFPFPVTFFIFILTPLDYSPFLITYLRIVYLLCLEVASVCLEGEGPAHLARRRSRYYD